MRRVERAFGSYHRKCIVKTTAFDNDTFAWLSAFVLLMCVLLTSSVPQAAVFWVNNPWADTLTGRLWDYTFAASWWYRVLRRCFIRENTFEERSVLTWGVRLWILEDSLEVCEVRGLGDVFQQDQEEAVHQGPVPDPVLPRRWQEQDGGGDRAAALR